MHFPQIVQNFAIGQGSGHLLRAVGPGLYGGSFVIVQAHAQAGVGQQYRAGVADDVSLGPPLRFEIDRQQAG
jgi:hypothetical protein